MKKIVIASILTMAILVGGVSCNKYEDGPSISLRGKKARVDGKWKFNSYNVVSGSIDTDLTVYSPGLETTYFYDGTWALGGSSGVITYSGSGTWEFNDDKTQLISTDDNGDNTEWTITKLKHKELWLTRTGTLGEIYTIHYEPVED